MQASALVSFFIKMQDLPALLWKNETLPERLIIFSEVLQSSLKKI